MTSSHFGHNGLEVAPDLRKVLLGNSPLGNRRDHVVDGVLLFFVDIRNEQHVRTLLQHVAGVEAFVHYRIVVNHPQDQALLGDKDFLLVMLFKGISEGAAATMRIGQLAGIGYLPQSLSHKTLGIRQDRLAIGRVVLLDGFAHASSFFATAVLPQ